MTKESVLRCRFFFDFCYSVSLYYNKELMIVV